jgi:hypothetical protein
MGLVPKAKPKIGRPRRVGRATSDVQVKLRLTEHEFRTWERASRDADKSVVDWARDLCNEAARRGERS